MWVRWESARGEWVGAEAGVPCCARCGCAVVGLAVLVALASMGRTAHADEARRCAACRAWVGAGGARVLRQSGCTTGWRGWSARRERVQPRVGCRVWCRGVRSVVSAAIVTNPHVPYGTYVLPVGGTLPSVSRSKRVAACTPPCLNSTCSHAFLLAAGPHHRGCSRQTAKGPQGPRPPQQQQPGGVRARPRHGSRRTQTLCNACIPSREQSCGPSTFRVYRV